jgi:hypothetical protein
MLKKPRRVSQLRQKVLVLAAAILVGLAMLSFAGLALANEGNPSMVLTVDNQNVSCESPVQGPKIEGDFGQTIVVSAEDPIDFVTVKSGVGAFVVSAEFDTNQGQITLSKDISGYVVWTCPSTTPPPTETTSSTVGPSTSVPS